MNVLVAGLNSPRMRSRHRQLRWPDWGNSEGGAGPKEEQARAEEEQASAAVGPEPARTHKEELITRAAVIRSIRRGISPGLQS